MYANGIQHAQKHHERTVSTFAMKVSGTRMPPMINPPSAPMRCADSTVGATRDRHMWQMRQRDGTLSRHLGNGDAQRGHSNGLISSATEPDTRSVHATVTG